MHWATDTGVLGQGASVVPTTEDHSRRSRGVMALTSTPGSTRVSSAEDVLDDGGAAAAPLLALESRQPGEPASATASMRELTSWLAFSKARARLASFPWSFHSS